MLSKETPLVDCSARGVSCFSSPVGLQFDGLDFADEGVLSFDRNDETTLITASPKPPMLRMSSRSGAWLDPYGWMSMHTSFGSVMPWRRWFSTNCCHSANKEV
jgi:hypothetical protein